MNARYWPCFSLNALIRSCEPLSRPRRDSQPPIHESASPSCVRLGEARSGRSKPRQSTASKTELVEDFLVRNALAAGHGCLSLRIPPTLLKELIISRPRRQNPLQFSRTV